MKLLYYLLAQIVPPPPLHIAVPRGYHRGRGR